MSDINTMRFVAAKTSAGTNPIDTFSVNAENGDLFINDPITSELSTCFTSMMKYLESRNSPVNIYINSPGGEVNSGLVMYDIIRSYPYEINIYCTGMAASMAAVLLAGGRKGHRYVLPHSKVMIHEPLIADGFGGSATTIEKKAQCILETKSLINGILAKHTGKTIEEINEATAFGNFMSAEEAVSFGLCDAVKDIF